MFSVISFIVTVIGVVATIVGITLSIVSRRRRTGVRATLKATKEHKAGAAEVYVHPTGRFERRLDGGWNEYNDRSEVIYRFEEFSRDEQYIYLKDSSRSKDPGRPMLLRLPISGGTAHWTHPNPLEWKRFSIVQPKP